MISINNHKFYHIGRLFSEFLTAHKKIQEITQLYSKGELSYNNIRKDTSQPRRFFDEGGFFYKLKELAHKTKKQENLDSMEKSLCWILETDFSNLFHRLTTARELLYQSYKNKEKANDLQLCLIRDNPQYHHSDITNSLNAIIESNNSAQSELESVLKDVKQLIEPSKEIFKRLIKIEKENHFIKYAIYNNLDDVKKVYGENNALDILNELYSCNEIEFKALFRDSLIEKGFYEDAKKINLSLEKEYKI